MLETIIYIVYLNPDKDNLNDVVCPTCILSGLLSVSSSHVLPDTTEKRENANYLTR